MGARHTLPRTRRLILYSYTAVDDRPNSKNGLIACVIFDERRKPFRRGKNRENAKLKFSGPVSFLVVFNVGFYIENLVYVFAL